jgi:hypothetical protein
MTFFIELPGMGNILLFFSEPTCAERELARLDQKLQTHRKARLPKVKTITRANPTRDRY